MTVASEKAAATRARNKARREARERADALVKAEVAAITRRIAALENVTIERGATEGEAANARSLARKLVSKPKLDFLAKMANVPPPLPSSIDQWVRKGRRR